MVSGQDGQTTQSAGPVVEVMTEASRDTSAAVTSGKRTRRSDFGQADEALSGGWRFADEQVSPALVSRCGFRFVAQASARLIGIIPFHSIGMLFPYL